MDQQYLSKILVVLLAGFLGWHLAGWITSPSSEPSSDRLTIQEQPIQQNCEEEITDIDGNSYSTWQFKDQCWMGENLSTTRYRDGEEIARPTTDEEWRETGLNETGAYACYDDQEENCNTYGALYNSYAVATGKLCPEGWQVPSDDDWKELEQELGMSREEADLLYWRGNPLGIKLAGNYELWDEDSFRDREEFGETGFDAVPAGYRMSNGRYSWLNKRANIWSSTLRASGWRRTIIYSSSGIRRTAAAKNFGFSVRCIKDR